MSKFLKFPDVLLIPVILVAFVASYGIVHLAMHTRNNVSLVKLSDVSYGSYDSAYKIESDVQKENIREIEGWFVLEGITYNYYNFGEGAGGSSVYNNMHLALIDGDNVVLLPTVLVLRKDVTRKLRDGTNYRYCGFKAIVPTDYLDFAKDATFYMAVTDPYDNMELYEIE